MRHLQEFMEEKIAILYALFDYVIVAQKVTMSYCLGLG